MELVSKCYENWKIYSVLSQRVAGLLGQSSAFSTAWSTSEHIRRPSVRLHRRYTKLKRMKDYFEAKGKQHQEDIILYRKGQLDPKPANRAIVAKASTSELIGAATASRPVVKRRRRQ